VITFVHWRSVPVCRSRQPVTVTTLNSYNMYRQLWITSARDGHHLKHCVQASNQKLLKTDVWASV
jgi:hypothetical protein